MVFSARKSAYFGIVLGTIAASLPLVAPEVQAEAVTPMGLTHEYCPAGYSLIAPIDPTGHFACEAVFFDLGGVQQWTVPDGVSTIDLLLGGGGGGGGGGGLGSATWDGVPTARALSATRVYAGGGGGAGEVEVHTNVAVTSGSTIDFELGNGGNRAVGAPDVIGASPALPWVVTAAAAGGDTVWNQGEFTAKGGGAGATYGQTTATGWSGGGGVGVGETDAATAGLAGTGTGPGGGNGTSTAISCADLATFFTAYPNWADTCPYSGAAAANGAYSNLMFVAGGGGGGNGGPGSSASIGLEPDELGCSTANTTVFGGDGGAPAAQPGGLFAIGASPNYRFGDLSLLGAGGGGAAVSPSAEFPSAQWHCATSGEGATSELPFGTGGQVAPDAASLGLFVEARSAGDVTPASGGSGCVSAPTSNDTISDFGCTNGSSGFVVIRFPAFIGYASGAHVLNEGGAQTKDDGLEIAVGGSQMQVYRYNPSYSEVSDAGCTPTSCVLELQPAAPHQAQFFDAYPPADPNTDDDETPNGELSNNWYLGLVDDAGVMTTLVGPHYPNDEVPMPVTVAPWTSSVTTGGSLASSHLTGGSGSTTTVLTYDPDTTPSTGDEYVMTVTVSYVGYEQEANVTIAVDEPTNGSTDTYRVYHYMDTYLLGGDQGAGFYDESDPAHPMVGAAKTLVDGTSQMIAMRNNGLGWSGYASNYYNCANGGFGDTEYGYLCGGSANSPAPEAMYQGGMLWTGSAALGTDPTTDNAIAAVWELPSDGTGTTGVIDYDLVFEVTSPPAEGNVYIAGRNYNSNPQSCTNTPFHSLFDALDTTPAIVVVGEEPAADGDTVYVCPGTYLEKFTSDVAPNVTVVGLDSTGQPATGDDRPVIRKPYDESLVGPLFFVDSGDFTLRNVVIDGVTGSTDVQAEVAQGGAISSNGSVWIYDSEINNSTALDGGAINAIGDVRVERSSFAGNTAVHFNCDGDYACEYSDSPGRGGAIATDGLVTVIDSTFAGNSARTTGSLGGAVWADRTEVRDSTFTDNSARDGGAIWNDGANSADSWTTRITGSTFEHNSAIDFGGAVLTDRAEVIDSAFSNNTSLAGGALLAYEWADISTSTFAANVAAGEGASGGAVYVAGAPVTRDGAPVKPTDVAAPIETGPRVNIIGSTFTDNSGSFGGAVNSGDAPVYVEASTFTTNHGADSSNYYDGQGGAIFSMAPLTVVSSTFDRNDTDDGDGEQTGSGGAIYAQKWDEPNFDVTVVNSTFVGNLSSVGGAISAALAKVTYSTFLDNSAQFGGAVNLYHTFEVQNSVFVGNAVGGGSCIYTVVPGGLGVVDLGNNVADDDDCINSGISTVTSPANINLGTLADNGGSTQTVAFSKPSALYSAAACITADVFVDQRGVMRPRGGAGNCDVGAYEYLDLVPGPGHVYIVGRYYDGSADHDSTDSSFGAATACDNTPYTTITDAVLSATNGDTVHVCGITDGSGVQVPYNEATVMVNADDLTLEGDDWDTSAPELLGSAMTGGAESLIQVASNVKNFTLDKMALFGGNALEGGAVHAASAHVTIIDSEFESNVAITKGGAIYARSVTTRSTAEFIADGQQTNFVGNIAFSDYTVFESDAGGGAIYALESADVHDTGFAFGATSGDGGAVLAPRIDVTDSFFWINSANGDGGVLSSTAVGGAISVSGSAFVFNGFGGLTSLGGMACMSLPCVAGVARGGAIAATGAGSSVHLVQSSFSLNEALTSGGAVYAGGASLEATNNSFIVNMIDAGGFGGAITAGTDVAMELLHNTFYGNVGDGSSFVAGGGADSVTSHVTNNIFADALADDGATVTSCSDPDTRVVDGGGNLTTDDDCHGDLVTAAELGLAPIGVFDVLTSAPHPNLERFGSAMLVGYNMVVAPTSPSVAIDHIESIDGACAVDIDQRGVARPQFDGCDAGAYETEPTESVIYVEQNNTVGGGSCASPDYNTVDAAIAAAPDGATIHVCTGVYREPLLVPNQSDLTIEGDGVTQTIFDGESNPGFESSRHQILDASGASGLTIKNATFRHGLGITGGAINAGANALTLENVRFEDNEAVGDGGALVLGAESTMDRVQFEGNTAGGNGGAISTLGNLTLTNSSFGGNSSTDGAGGAVYAAGFSVTARNSTFVENSADAETASELTDGFGGAIFAEQIVSTFSSFYDNTAAFGGAAVAAEDGGRLSLTASLFLRSAVDGVDGGSCFAGVEAPILDYGSNISGDDTCYDTIDAASQENVDYLTVVDQNPAEPYDFWGGTTKTLKLATGGPAIDAAACSLDPAVIADQRGIERPQGADCDSGAFELDEAAPAVYIVGRFYNGVSEGEDEEGAAPESCTNTPYSTVQAAVSAAVDNDIVHVCAGTYVESDINWEHQTLTIEGDGPDVTSIDGDGVDRVLNFPGDDITLRSITIENGVTADNGGGVLAGVVRASDVTFRNNAAANGGAIYTADEDGSGTVSFVSLIDCYFRSNGGLSTVFGGAVYADNGGTVVVDGSNFRENSAIFFAGGAGVPAPQVLPITAKGASVEGSGGAIIAGTIVVTSSRFVNNSAFTHGGALLATTISVEHSDFWGNDADGDQFSPVKVDGYGGAIWGSAVAITSSSFGQNSATVGGAVGVIAAPGTDSVGTKSVENGAVVIDSSTFESNTAATYGAAIYNQSGAVDSTNSTYYGNAATKGGGAIQSVGNMTLVHNTFDQNTAGELATGGGTLLTGAEVFATNNIFSYTSGERYGYDGCQFDWLDTSKIHDLGGNLSSDDWCIGRAWTTDEEFALNDLDENGGPTLTMKIDRGSLARDYIEVGEGCASDVDQRGVSRPQFVACDSGAYEYNLQLPTITVTAAESQIDSGATDDLSATVSAAAGAPAPSGALVPTGRVQFYYCVPADLTEPATCADPANWTEIGERVKVDSTGTAQYPAWAPPADGTYEVHAKYFGDDNFEVIDTTTSGSATVVVGVNLSSIKVCVHRTSVTYGKKLPNLDVDYCVPIGECFPAPTGVGPASHNDACCPATSPTTLDGSVTTQDDKCCPVSPDTVVPMDPGHCLTEPEDESIDEEDAAVSTVEPDLVYSEVDQGWVAATPTADDPSAPEASGPGIAGGKEELPEGYYEVEPKKVYEWYGVVPPTCTVPDYEVGTSVTESPLDITCEGGDPGTGYQFDFSLVDEQEFTVLPAELRLKAEHQHLTFGDPVPTYTYRVRGFKLGETPDTASGWVDAVCTSDYTPSSPAGSRFPITCSGAGADNYVFKYEESHLEVRKARLRVDPTSMSIDYGSSVPSVFAWSLSGLKSAEAPAAAEMLAGYVAPKCSSTYSTGSNAGTYAITCSGGDAKNYEFDTSTAGTLTVRKVGLKVTPKSSMVPYGTSKPMLGFSLTGLVAGESAPGVGYQAPVCSADAYTSSTPAGSVLAVSCTGGSATNYTFDTASTTSMTVVKAPLKVVPASPTVVYGSAASALTVSITGFANGQTPSTSAGYVAPTCSYSYSITTPAGSYPITCSGGSAANYAFDTSSVGLLTVSKAPITITPTSVSVVYGATKPVHGFTMSGFKNSQTASVLTSQPTCTSAYAQGSGVGTYAVNCTGGAAANYSFVTAPAAVTVTPAPLVVQPDPKVITYGDALPVYSASITGFVLGQSTAAAGLVAPTCSSAFTTLKPVGSYAITCAGASLANYSFTYRTSTLTVGKAVLTVAPVAKTITRGSAIPTYTYTMSGFKYGQTSTTVAGLTAPKCTSKYTRTSPIGNYTITCSSGAATNYTFQYTTAILRVI